jgi:tight adherence protein B
MTRLSNTMRRAVGVLVPAALALLLPVQAGTASARAQSPATGGPRVAMIVVDMSKALTGAQTEAERQAALRYADALPANVRVGLITFSASWQTALPPASDRGRLAAALAASQPTSWSAAGIYGAVAAGESAVMASGGAPDSRLLLLSEGEYIPSRTLTLTSPVDVVPWYHDGDDNTAALRALAGANGGHVAVPADAAALAAAFPFAAAQPAHARGTSHGPWSSELIAVLAAVFAAVLLAGLLVTGSLRREDHGRLLEARLDRHYGLRVAGPAADHEGRVASAAVDWVARLLGANVEQRLARRLDLAGIARKPAEWVLLGAAASLLLAVLLTALTGSPLLGVLAGPLVGWLGMHLVVSVRITRRRATFSEQLPDVLQLVAGSLQSGFSLPQALDAVVREDTQPAAGEFSRALAETRIGGELEAAMDRVAERMDSTDLRWTVMAIRIQRSVGGNLVEVLRNTVDTMRERAQLRRHVRALSAEGRLSAYILIALPLLMAAYMFAARRDYLRPLYTTPFGLVMLIGGVVLIGLGSLWMRKLVKVEV